MALLLQSYQEKRELALQRQTQPQPRQTLGIQTSFIGGSQLTAIPSGQGVPSGHTAALPVTVEIFSQSDSQSSVQGPDDDTVVDVESTVVAAEADPDL